MESETPKNSNASLGPKQLNSASCVVNGNSYDLFNFRLKWKQYFPPRQDWNTHRRHRRPDSSPLKGMAQSAVRNRQLSLSRSKTTFYTPYDLKEEDTDRSHHLSSLNFEEDSVSDSEDDDYDVLKDTEPSKPKQTRKRQKVRKSGKPKKSEINKKKKHLEKDEHKKSSKVTGRRTKSLKRISRTRGSSDLPVPQLAKRAKTQPNIHLNHIEKKVEIHELDKKKKSAKRHHRDKSKSSAKQESTKKTVKPLELKRELKTSSKQGYKLSEVKPKGLHSKQIHEVPSDKDTYKLNSLKRLPLPDSWKWNNKTSMRGSPAMATTWKWFENPNQFRRRPPSSISSEYSSLNGNVLKSNNFRATTFVF